MSDDSNPAVTVFNPADLSQPLGADASLSDVIARINAITTAEQSAALSEADRATLARVTKFFA